MSNSSVNQLGFQPIDQVLLLMLPGQVVALSILRRASGPRYAEENAWGMSS
jgi:hypothetical protein